MATCGRCGDRERVTVRPMFVTDQDRARKAVLRVMLGHTDHTIRVVLLLLSGYPAGLTTRELSERGNLSLGRVRTAVRRLKAHRLIEPGACTRRGCGIAWVKVGGRYDCH